jgi:hypothetical protein
VQPIPSRVASKILAYTEIVVTYLSKTPNADRADRRMGWGAVLIDHLSVNEGLGVFPALAARRALMVARDHNV